MSNVIEDSQNEMIARLDAVMTQLQEQGLGDATTAKTMQTVVHIRNLLASPAKMAIAGEFSSGKTTMVRMLLGREFVATKASASAMPTVHFKYSERESFTLIENGIGRPIKNPDDLTEEEMRGADLLVINTDTPILKCVEIFDTPGTADPTRSSDQVSAIAEEVDFMIWCTNATQAWRESERRMWVEFPENVRENGILAVTHVDLPKVKASLPRLMKRLHRDAGAYFDHLMPVDLLSAIKSRLDARVANDLIGWNESGGEACLATIQSVADTVKTRQVSEIADFLANDPVIQALSSSEPAPSAVAAPKLVSAKSPLEFMELWSGKLREALQNTDPEHASDRIRAYSGLIKAFKDEHIGVWRESEPIRTEIIARLEEAFAFLNNNRPAGDPDNMSRDVLLQLDWEFKNIVVAGT